MLQQNGSPVSIHNSALCRDSSILDRQGKKTIAARRAPRWGVSVEDGLHGVWTPITRCRAPFTNKLSRIHSGWRSESVGKEGVK